MKPSILVIEDDNSLRDVLASFLESEGFSVHSAADAASGLQSFGRHNFDCVLSDFRLPDADGISILKKLREGDKRTPFVLMTAYGSIDMAVEALKEGANDFVTKPFDPVALGSLLRQVVEHKQITQRDASRLRRPRRFLTEDSATEEILRSALKVAQVDSPVLILGESGTGKELIARYIHENSPRRDNPFIAVNCAAMPIELLESEFFGHESGAFTGATQTRIGVLELASEGSIFLDEIGDMPLALQVKLLRALQEGEMKRVGGNALIKISPRIIAATHVDIEDALVKGKIREDFYYRIAVIDLQLRPLRARKKDIALLAQYFAEYFAARQGRGTPQFSKEALSLLRGYPWPGNTRELENVIERAMVLCGDKIFPEHLGIRIPVDVSPLEDAIRTLPEIAEEAMRHAERELIAQALQSAFGNKTKAAKRLGVSYKTLLNKIKEYGVSA